MNNWIQIRNKKVAISRWKRIHNKHRKHIRNNNIKHLKARILGYIAGDGNISVRRSKAGMHHVVRFYPDHVSIINAFNEAFVKVYNKKPIIKADHNFYCVKVYSKPVVLDMLNYAEFGTHSWRIPKRLLLNKNCKMEWIRAFFDAEAYVGPKHIKVHSVNKTGLEEIRNILLGNFDIKSKIYEYIPKNPNYSIQYSLIIAPKKIREKYLNDIGFNHKIKRDKLLNSLS